METKFTSLQLMKYGVLCILVSLLLTSCSRYEYQEKTVVVNHSQSFELRSSGTLNPLHHEHELKFSSLDYLSNDDFFVNEKIEAGEDVIAIRPIVKLDHLTVGVDPAEYIDDLKIYLQVTDQGEQILLAQLKSIRHGYIDLDQMRPNLQESLGPYDEYKIQVVVDLNQPIAIDQSFQLDLDHTIKSVKRSKELE